MKRAEAIEIALIQRIGALRLGTGDTRQFGDDAQVAHEQKTTPQRADVAKVAAGNDDPIRHLPVKLLHEFDADRLLALDA